MKRIQCDDNTDMIARAMEIAGDCDHMLILYEKKENVGGGTGFFHVGSATNAELNWMVDRFKLYLHGLLRKDDD